MRQNASFNLISLLQKIEDHQPFNVRAKNGVQSRSVGEILEKIRECWSEEMKMSRNKAILWLWWDRADSGEQIFRFRQIKSYDLRSH